MVIFPLAGRKIAIIFGIHSHNVETASWPDNGFSRHNNFFFLDENQTRLKKLAAVHPALQPLDFILEECCSFSLAGIYQGAETGKQEMTFNELNSPSMSIIRKMERKKPQNKQQQMVNVELS